MSCSTIRTITVLNNDVLFFITVQNKLRLHADELQTAAKDARWTASVEVLTHIPRDDFATPPRSSGTRGPRTSSEISSKAAYGSVSAHEKDPDINVVYDSGPTSSPRGRADPPHSPIVKLSTSMSEAGGPATKKWDSDRLHRFTRKG